MGVFHRATITPTKAELIAKWAPTQPWGPGVDAHMDVVGSYRFDDPENSVGMETHVVTTEGRMLQVPLVYRDEPVVGGDAALITEMQHSELGTRWVYDGLSDECYVVMLAAVAMTGKGEALGWSTTTADGISRQPTFASRVEGGPWSEHRSTASACVRRCLHRCLQQRQVRADLLPTTRGQAAPSHWTHGDLGGTAGRCRTRRGSGTLNRQRS